MLPVLDDMLHVRVNGAGRYVTRTCYWCWTICYTYVLPVLDDMLHVRVAGAGQLYEHILSNSLFAFDVDDTKYSLAVAYDIRRYDKITN